MFETAELGHKVASAEYRERAPLLRQRLLEAQARLRATNFPVIVLFAGVDGAGKGATVNLLCEWMDPRGIVTRAYDSPSDEEAERPPFWRYWRDLPSAGRVGIFLSAWYSRPLVGHVYGETDRSEFDEQLDEIVAFERMLAVDGAVILKFWMHLGKVDQKRRFKSLEKDPAESWRVTEQDWKNWRRYDDFVSAAERIMMRTSTGHAPWTIVDGKDPRYRSLKVGGVLCEEIERQLDKAASARTLTDLANQNGLTATTTATGAVASKAAVAEEGTGASTQTLESLRPETTTILSSLDLSKSLDKKTYNKRLREGQARLNQLYRKARAKKLSTILLFEGWDAGGKGGAIRRATAALDARVYEVITIAAPTDEEKVHHYLWRFWRYIPRAGRVTIFDRSWYGRILVERVEGFASETEWRRAPAEIDAFEQQLADHGILLLKFWLHISKEEQERRFQAREEIPYKRWKLTDEDWRNREKWDEYEVAVHDMIERTSTSTAPWVLVEGNDKQYAPIKVIEAICDRLETTLAEPKQVDKVTRDS